MAIDPAELEGLDEEGVRALYEERLAQQQSTASREVRHAAPSHPCKIAPINQLAARSASCSSSFSSLPACAGSVSYSALPCSLVPLRLRCLPL